MSNICERCGGVKTVYYEVEWLPGKRVALAQHQSSIMKLCMCPVERPKHDGRLARGDWECGYSVFHDKVYLSNPANLSPVVSIVATNAHALEEKLEVYLSPTQALSLLAWLRQEESALEELEKEQP